LKGEKVNLRELALRLSAITVIADAAKEAKDRLRDEFAQALNAVGADAAKAALNGTEVAKVSLVSPKPSPSVLHEQALINWVKANWETEIVESVRESFRKVILDKIENNNGVAVYPETGEVLDFISFKQRESYVSTRFASGGREVILDAFANGELSPSVMLSEEPLAVTN
jgi:hypothetical protein